ncbi:MAG: helix-turn-helix domain-containing protein [bacterium]|jgi:transcriptional regulator with XRE-family HTH domain
MDSEMPETSGEYLRNSRKSLGLTVDEVSNITKIRAQYIEAIENDDFAMFSSPHLLKGYIKLLAKTVKADEKKAAALLEAEAGENFKDKHIEDIVGKRFKEEIQKSKDFKKRILVIVFAGILIIILSYAIIKIYEYIKTAPRIHIAMPFQSRIKSLVPEGHPSVSGRPPKIRANYPVILKGKVIKRTWVAVKIDGGSAATSMLYAGDTETWKAKKRIRIKIGNAGGIVLNYNGKDIGSPGTEKQVVTLNFPPKHNNSGKQSVNTVNK